MGDDIDGGMGNIKMKILPFKGMSDLKAYLAWKEKVELIIDCNNYSEEREIKLSMTKFVDYAIIW